MTFSCGGAALIIIGSAMQNLDTAVGQTCYMSFALQPQAYVGQNTNEVFMPPDDTRAIQFTKTRPLIFSQEYIKTSGVFWVNGLVPEKLYLLRAKYRTTGGMGIFQFRQVGVIPL
jgi:hypothetical protein